VGHRQRLHILINRQYAVSEYRALLNSWLILSQNNATYDGGTCYGDSGGPVFWQETNNNASKILLGITSWGDIPCVSTGFYYRIDTMDSLEFIDSKIDEIES
jgi:secreted trypsin-like serine protease